MTMVTFPNFIKKSQFKFFNYSALTSDKQTHVHVTTAL